MRYLLLLSFFLALGHGELSAFDVQNNSPYNIWVVADTYQGEYSKNVKPNSHEDGWDYPDDVCLTFTFCRTTEGGGECTNGLWKPYDSSSHGTLTITGVSPNGYVLVDADECEE